MKNSFAIRGDRKKNEISHAAKLENKLVFLSFFLSFFLSLFIVNNYSSEGTSSSGYLRSLEEVEVNNCFSIFQTSE